MESKVTSLSGVFGANIVHFIRGLRRAGLPIGSGQVLDALRATHLIDVSHREDFYWALASVLIDRHAQLELFDMAFRYFWEQSPFLVPHPSAAPASDADTEPAEIAQRVAQAFASVRISADEEKESIERAADATFTASRRELLAKADFQSMSIEQLREAKRMLAQLRLPINAVKTRRFRPDARGRRVDMRATLRESLRDQGEIVTLRRRSPRHEHPPLVVLCDISGSMHRYAEMLLHFLHTIINDRDRVHVFLFGTRLTNVTRALRHRDVDTALAATSKSVVDWSGGTRIGSSLAQFNQLWSRRVLGQNAVVLIITDGLERDETALLSLNMERLRKSCRNLIWLNPLLRYEAFEPLAAGVRAMLPYVDELRAAHNVASLTDLAQALSAHPIHSAIQRRNKHRWK